MEVPYAYAPRVHGTSKTATSLVGLVRRGLPYLRMVARLVVLDRTAPRARRREAR